MMIKIICSAQAYTYNAYHIVKAFYPAVEITNHVEEKASNYVEINFSCLLYTSPSPRDTR